jgi:hypothetical protein
MSFLADQAVTIVGDSGSGYPQEISSNAGADAYIIDIPIIRDNDDLNFAGQFPVYLHISPLVPTSTWVGGALYFALNSVDYLEAAANTNEGAVGMAVNVPNVPQSVLQTDYDNTITMVVREGDSTTFTSATEAEVFEGANLCAYGNNGRWELIQFQDITDNGNNTFTLSKLNRARRGTDYAVDFHRVGDFIIPLGVSYTDMTAFTFSQINLSFNYKGVGFGQDESLVIPKRTTLAGYAALPWVPTIPTLVRDRTALTGDITIDWERRSRTSGALVDSVENSPIDGTGKDPVTLAETYKVTIWRHPYLTDWEYIAGLWNPQVPLVMLDPTPLEVIVSGATSLVLTYAAIRAAQLYEFSATFDPTNPSAVFAQVGGAFDSFNANENLQMVDIGYDEFMAFSYLDIMIQQEGNMGGIAMYGPGRKMRIYIQDV